MRESSGRPPFAGGWPRSHSRLIHGRPERAAEHLLAPRSLSFGRRRLRTHAWHSCDSPPVLPRSGAVACHDGTRRLPRARAAPSQELARLCRRPRVGRAQGGALCQVAASPEPLHVIHCTSTYMYVTCRPRRLASALAERPRAHARASRARSFPLPVACARSASHALPTRSPPTWLTPPPPHAPSSRFATLSTLCADF